MGGLGILIFNASNADNASNGLVHRESDKGRDSILLALKTALMALLA